jgi:hypothetical protein
MLGGKVTSEKKSSVIYSGTVDRDITIAAIPLSSIQNPNSVILHPKS